SGVLETHGCRGTVSLSFPARGVPRDRGGDSLAPACLGGAGVVSVDPASALDDRRVSDCVCHRIPWHGDAATDGGAPDEAGRDAFLCRAPAGFQRVARGPADGGGGRGFFPPHALL